MSAAVVTNGQPVVDGRRAYQPSPMNRREFFRALRGAGLSSRSAPSRRRKKVRRKLTHGAPRGDYNPNLLKLINRATMGFSRSTYAEAEAMGYDDFLEYQLDYESIEDSAWEARLQQYGFFTLNLTSAQIYSLYRNDAAIPVGDLIRAAWLRAAFSKRQLFERMVAFWTDHFNIDITKNLCRWLKTADDRDVIRQYAMTSFPELLSASAHSPAMLFYLDNYANIAGHAQENYARELMELHSMGVNGGYSQGDVEEVARCFTGWTIYDNPFGEFAYWPPFHDTGSKTVLGHKIPAGGGESDGLTVLDIISSHPSTARFIAKKLCTWFLGYDPPEDIVESVKQTYLTSKPMGDIKSMLRVILQENVLAYLSTPKVKRPMHLVASLLRATDAEVLNPRYFDVPLYLMGHLPFYWETPDGYPDTAETWGSSVRPRWDFLSDVVHESGSVDVDYLGLLASESGDLPGEQGEAINRILTGGSLSPEDASDLQAFYDGFSPGLFVTSDTFGLATSLPGFQWY